MEELSALLKFNKAGELIEVLPNAATDQDMEVLRNALLRLIDHGPWESFSRLLNRE
jgi:hypothetical protein